MIEGHQQSSCGGEAGSPHHKADTEQGRRLVDGFGRIHTSMRISVTDRCNIRCFYCMPAGPIDFLPRRELLDFEELVRVSRVATGLGIDQIRLTGGEPLVRKELWELIRMLKRLPGLSELSLTTNGLLLPEQAGLLKDAGLDRLNISLDSLRPEVFRQITRRDGVNDVVAGIRAAQAAGFRSIRINAVSIAGLTEPDILPLVRFCRESALHLRFIEFMPLDADGLWQEDQVLTGAAVRQVIEREWGRLEPVPEADPHQPATDYRFADGAALVGFINPVSQPFCSTCNRLRLTAEGRLRNCLFAREETDLRKLLRGGGTDGELCEVFRQSVQAKKKGHGMDDPGFQPPQRAMYQIGG